MPDRPDLSELERLLAEVAASLERGGRVAHIIGSHGEEWPDEAALLLLAVNALPFLLAEARRAETLTKENERLGELHLDRTKRTAADLMDSPTRAA